LPPLEPNRLKKREDAFSQPIDLILS
jgi:hypothetical protein